MDQFVLDKPWVVWMCILHGVPGTWLNTAALYMYPGAASSFPLLSQRINDIERLQLSASFLYSSLFRPRLATSLSFHILSLVI